MHSHKKAWLVINVLGGAAILGSYAHGLSTHDNAAELLWGTTPEELKAVYGVTMLLAAAGYVPFSYLFFFRTDPAKVTIASFGYGLINTFYAMIMVFSALWMPLTFAYFDEPSRALWLAIRVDLFLVGLGSLGLLFALFVMKPRAGGLLGVLALLGLLLFTLQTAFLDAVVWPQFIPGT